MKHAAKIFWGMLVATAIFVIVALVIEMFNKSSTEIFEVTLYDAELADVIIITSTPYSEKEWTEIKNIVKQKSAHMDDTKKFNKQLFDLLNFEGYSVISFNLSRKVVKFQME